MQNNKAKAPKAPIFFSSIKLEIKNPFKNGCAFLRFSAAITFIAFSLTSIVLISPFSLTSTAFAGVEEISISTIQALGLANLSIPPELGTIESRFQGSQAGQLVIHIQDAHASSDAQTHIQKIIEYFENNFGLRLVTFEGIEGELDPFLLRAFPNREMLKEALNPYVRRGELSGIDLAAAVNEKESRYAGLEDRNIYDAGIALFLDAQKALPVVEHALNQIEDEIAEGQRRTYSPELMEIAGKVRDFEYERIDLATLAGYLEGKVAPPENGHLERLAAVTSDSEKSAGEITALAQQMDPAELWREIRAWALSAKEKLFKSDLERRLDQAEERVRFLKELARLQITPDQFQSYLAEKSAYEPEQIQLFLSEIGQDDQIAFDVSNAVLFYRNALVRDHILSDRLITFLAEKKTSVAAFVSGGFHTAGVTERLEKEGVSYVVIQPAMKDFNGGSRYLDVMQGNVSYRDRFERNAKGEVNLYRAFGRDITEYLFRKISERGLPSREIKNWRDEIIRRSVARGRATDAYRYTYFIDEMVERLRSQAEPLSSKEEFVRSISNLLRGFGQSYQKIYKEKVMREFNGLMEKAKQLHENGNLTFGNLNSLIFGGPKTSGIVPHTHVFHDEFVALEGRPNDGWKEVSVFENPSIQPKGELVSAGFGVDAMKIMRADIDEIKTAVQGHAGINAREAFEYLPLALEALSRRGDLTTPDIKEILMTFPKRADINTIISSYKFLPQAQEALDRRSDLTAADIKEIHMTLRRFAGSFMRTAYEYLPSAMEALSQRKDLTGTDIKEILNAITRYNGSNTAPAYSSSYLLIPLKALNERKDLTDKDVKEILITISKHAGMYTREAYLSLPRALVALSRRKDLGGEETHFIFTSPFIAALLLGDFEIFISYLSADNSIPFDQRFKKALSRIGTHLTSGGKVRFDGKNTLLSPNLSEDALADEIIRLKDTKKNGVPPSELQLGVAGIETQRTRMIALGFFIASTDHSNFEGVLKSPGRDLESPQGLLIAGINVEAPYPFTETPSARMDYLIPYPKGEFQDKAKLTPLIRFVRYLSYGLYLAEVLQGKKREALSPDEIAMANVYIKYERELVKLLRKYEKYKDRRYLHKTKNIEDHKERLEALKGLKLEESLWPQRKWLVDLATYTGEDKDWDELVPYLRRVEFTLLDMEPIEEGSDIPVAQQFLLDIRNLVFESAGDIEAIKQGKVTIDETIALTPDKDPIIDSEVLTSTTSYAKALAKDLRAGNLTLEDIPDIRAIEYYTGEKLSGFGVKVVGAGLPRLYVDTAGEEISPLQMSALRALRDTLHVPSASNPTTPRRKPEKVPLKVPKHVPKPSPSKPLPKPAPEPVTPKKEPVPAGFGLATKAAELATTGFVDLGEKQYFQERFEIFTDTKSGQLMWKTPNREVIPIDLSLQKPRLRLRKESDRSLDDLLRGDVEASDRFIQALFSNIYSNDTSVRGQSGIYKTIDTTQEFVHKLIRRSPDGEMADTITQMLDGVIEINEAGERITRKHPTLIAIDEAIANAVQTLVVRATEEGERFAGALMVRAYETREKELIVEIVDDGMGILFALREKLGREEFSWRPEGSPLATGIGKGLTRHYQDALRSNVKQIEIHTKSIEKAASEGAAEMENPELEESVLLVNPEPIGEGISTTVPKWQKSERRKRGTLIRFHVTPIVEMAVSGFGARKKQIASQRDEDLFARFLEEEIPKIANELYVKVRAEDGILFWRSSAMLRLTGEYSPYWYDLIADRMRIYGIRSVTNERINAAEELVVTAVIDRYVDKRLPELVRQEINAFLDAQQRQDAGIQPFDEEQFREIVSKVFQAVVNDIPLEKGVEPAVMGMTGIWLHELIVNAVRRELGETGFGAGSSGVAREPPTASEQAFAQFQVDLREVRDAFHKKNDAEGDARYRAEAVHGEKGSLMFKKYDFSEPDLKAVKQILDFAPGAKFEVVWDGNSDFGGIRREFYVVQALGKTLDPSRSFVPNNRLILNHDALPNLMNSFVKGIRNSLFGVVGVLIVAVLGAKLFVGSIVSTQLVWITGGFLTIVGFFTGNIVSYRVMKAKWGESIEIKHAVQTIKTGSRDKEPQAKKQDTSAGFGTELPEFPDERQLGEVLTNPAKPLLKRDNVFWRSQGFTTPGTFRLDGKIYLVVRGIDEHGVSRLGLAVSRDGYTVDQNDILPIPIFEPLLAEGERGVENARITVLDGKIYMLYTAREGPDVFKIGLASITVDQFREGLKEGNWVQKWARHKLELNGRLDSNANDRNAAILPEKINGKFAMYFRDLDPQTQTRVIRLALADHPEGSWEAVDSKQVVLTPAIVEAHLKEKPAKPIVWVGIGSPPIRTKDGWLSFFHYVDEDHNYRIGFFISDAANPLKILYVHDRPIWEISGTDYNNVESDELHAIPRGEALKLIVRRFKRGSLSGFWSLVDAVAFRQMRGHKIPAGDRYTIHVSGAVPEFDVKVLEAGDRMLLYGGVFNTRTGLGVFEYPEIGDIIAKTQNLPVPERTSLSDKKILVIEDSPVIREAIVQALRDIGKVDPKFGGQIIAPSSFLELKHVLEEAHSGRTSFDALILDHNIKGLKYPDINFGHEILRYLSVLKGYGPRATIYYTSAQALKEETRLKLLGARWIRKAKSDAGLDWIVSPEDLVRWHLPAMLAAKDRILREQRVIPRERIVEEARKLLGVGIGDIRRTIQGIGDPIPLQAIWQLKYRSDSAQIDFINRPFGGGIVLVYATRSVAQNTAFKDGELVIFVHENGQVRTGKFSGGKFEFAPTDTDASHGLYFGKHVTELVRAPEPLTPESVPPAAGFGAESRLGRALGYGLVYLAVWAAPLTFVNQVYWTVPWLWTRHSVHKDPYGYFAANWGGDEYLNSFWSVHGYLGDAIEALEIKEATSTDKNKKIKFEYYYAETDKAKKKLEKAITRIDELDKKESEFDEKETDWGGEDHFTYHPEDNRQLAGQVAKIEKSIPDGSFWDGRYVTSRSSWSKGDEFEDERDRISVVMNQIGSKGANFYQWVDPDVKAKFEWAKWWFALATLISGIHGRIIRALFKSGLYEESSARIDRFRDDIKTGISGLKSRFVGSLGIMSLAAGVSASVSERVPKARRLLAGFMNQRHIEKGPAIWYPFVSNDRLWIRLTAEELSEKALVVTERYKPGKKESKGDVRSYVVINIPEKGPEGTRLFTATIAAHGSNPKFWRFRRSGWLWPNRMRFPSFRMMSAQSAGLSDEVPDVEHQLLLHARFGDGKLPRRIRNLQSIEFSILTPELTDGLQKAFLNGERAAEKFAASLPELDRSQIYPSAGFGAANQVTTIVFDLTGTLLTDGLSKAIETISGVFGIETEKVKHWLKDSEQARALRLGSLQSDEYWSYVLEVLKGETREIAATEEARKFFALEFSQQKDQLRRWFYDAYEEIPGVSRMLVSLEKSGYRVAIFTNMERERAQHLKTRFPWLPSFIITSADVGVTKPDLRGFKKVFDLLKQEWGVTQPQEIYYVDDDISNLIPPKEIGWHTQLVEKETPLPDSFEIRQLLERRKSNSFGTAKEELIARLKSSPDKQTRLTALVDLIEMSVSANRNAALFYALSDPDGEIRELASFNLGDQGAASVKEIVAHIENPEVPQDDDPRLPQGEKFDATIARRNARVAGIMALEWVLDRESEDLKKVGQGRRPGKRTREIRALITRQALEWLDQGRVELTGLEAKHMLGSGAHVPLFYALRLLMHWYQEENRADLDAAFRGDDMDLPLSWAFRAVKKIYPNRLSRVGKNVIYEPIDKSTRRSFTAAPSEIQPPPSPDRPKPSGFGRKFEEFKDVLDEVKDIMSQVDFEIDQAKKPQKKESWLHKLSAVVAAVWFTLLISNFINLLLTFWGQPPFQYGLIKSMVATFVTLSILVKFFRNTMKFFRATSRKGDIEKPTRKVPWKKFKELKKKASQFERGMEKIALVSTPFIMWGNWGTIAESIKFAIQYFASWHLHFVLAALMGLNVFFHVVGKLGGSRELASTDEKKDLAFAATYIAPIAEEVVFRYGLFNAIRWFWVSVAGFSEPFNYMLPFFNVAVGFNLPLGVFISMATNAEIFFKAHGKNRWFHHWLLGAINSYLYYTTGSLVVPIVIHFIWNWAATAVDLALEAFLPLKKVPLELIDSEGKANSWLLGRILLHSKSVPNQLILLSLAESEKRKTGKGKEDFYYRLIYEVHTEFLDLQAAQDPWFSRNRERFVGSLGIALYPNGKLKAWTPLHIRTDKGQDEFSGIASDTEGWLQFLNQERNPFSVDNRRLYRREIVEEKEKAPAGFGSERDKLESVILAVAILGHGGPMDIKSLVAVLSSHARAFSMTLTVLDRLESQSKFKDFHRLMEEASLQLRISANRFNEYVERAERLEKISINELSWTEVEALSIEYGAWLEELRERTSRVKDLADDIFALAENEEVYRNDSQIQRSKTRIRAFAVRINLVIDVLRAFLAPDSSVFEEEFNLSQWLRSADWETKQVPSYQVSVRSGEASIHVKSILPLLHFVIERVISNGFKAIHNENTRGEVQIDFWQSHNFFGKNNVFIKITNPGRIEPELLSLDAESHIPKLLWLDPNRSHFSNSIALPFSRFVLQKLGGEIQVVNRKDDAVDFVDSIITLPLEPVVSQETHRAAGFGAESENQAPLDPLTLRVAESEIATEVDESENLLEFNHYMYPLSLSGNFYAYTYSLIGAYKNGLLIEKPDLSKLLPMLAKDTVQNSSYYLVLIAAIEAKIITDKSDLAKSIRWLEEVNRWSDYLSVLVSAYNARVIERSDLDEFLGRVPWSGGPYPVDPKTGVAKASDLDELLQTRTDKDERDYDNQPSRKIRNAAIGYNLDRVFQAVEEYARINWDYCSKIVVDAMELKIITKRSDLDRPLRLFSERRKWHHYAEILIKAMEVGIVSERSEVDELLKMLERDGRWEDHALTVIAAHKSSVVTERLTLNKSFQGMASKGMWSVYSIILINAMESGYFHIDHDRLRKWHEESKKYGLSSLSFASSEYLKRKFDVSGEIVSRWRTEAKAMFDNVRKKNEEAVREDQKIDVDAFDRYLSQALMHLFVISENITKQILDRYLDQRGYLPMLRDVFQTAAFLRLKEIRVLRNFYEKTGNAFIDDPTFFLNLIGYMEAYASLGLVLDIFEEDLMMSTGTQADIDTRLGRKVIQTISDQLKITIDLDQVKGRRDILKEWDLRFLGLLIAARSNWQDQRKEAFFTLLLKSALERTEPGLLYPPAYRRFPKEIYGQGYEETVQNVRRHNLKFLKELESAGLDVNVWLKPNEVVTPRLTEGQGVQRRDVDIVRDFRRRLDAFKTWLSNNSDLGDWRQIERSLGSWATIDANRPSPKILNNKNSLKKFKSFIQKLTDRTPQGNVPEPLADMGVILDEIMYFDLSARATAENYLIRFWRRDVGQDVFIGNCAGSCTALGLNASAIFEFLLDQGTQYVVIENARGEVKGYARFFAALDGEGKPLLFIDSVDGFSAKNYEHQMRVYIEDFAKALGLEKDRVMDRTGGIVSRKIGGVLTAGYLHHSGAELIHEFLTDLSLDDWQPQGGWLLDSEIETGGRVAQQTDLLSGFGAKKEDTYLPKDESAPFRLRLDREQSAVKVEMPDYVVTLYSYGGYSFQSTASGSKKVDGLTEDEMLKQIEDAIGQTESEIAETDRKEWEVIQTIWVNFKKFHAIAHIAEVRPFQRMLRFGEGDDFFWIKIGSEEIYVDANGLILQRTEYSPERPLLEYKREEQLDKLSRIANVHERISAVWKQNQARRKELQDVFGVEPEFMPEIHGDKTKISVRVPRESEYSHAKTYTMDHDGTIKLENESILPSEDEKHRQVFSLIESVIAVGRAGAPGHFWFDTFPEIEPLWNEIKRRRQYVRDLGVRDFTNLPTIKRDGVRPSEQTVYWYFASADKGLLENWHHLTAYPSTGIIKIQRITGARPLNDEELIAKIDIFERVVKKYDLDTYTLWKKALDKRYEILRITGKDPYYLPEVTEINKERSYINVALPNGFRYMVNWDGKIERTKLDQIVGVGEKRPKLSDSELRLLDQTVRSAAPLVPKALPVWEKVFTLTQKARELGYFTLADLPELLTETGTEGTRLIVPLKDGRRLSMWKDGRVEIRVEDYSKEVERDAHLPDYEPEIERALRDEIVVNGENRPETPLSFYRSARSRRARFSEHDMSPEIVPRFIRDRSSNRDAGVDDENEDILKVPLKDGRNIEIHVNGLIEVDWSSYSNESLNILADIDAGIREGSNLPNLSEIQDFWNRAKERFLLLRQHGFMTPNEMPALVTVAVRKSSGEVETFDAIKIPVKKLVWEKVIVNTEGEKWIEAGLITMTKQSGWRGISAEEMDVIYEIMERAIQVDPRLRDHWIVTYDKWEPVEEEKEDDRRGGFLGDGIRRGMFGSRFSGKRSFVGLTTSQEKRLAGIEKLTKAEKLRRIKELKLPSGSGFGAAGREPAYESRASGLLENEINDIARIVLERHEVPEETDIAKELVLILARVRVQVGLLVKRAEQSGKQRKIIATLAYSEIEERLSEAKDLGDELRQLLWGASIWHRKLFHHYVIWKTLKDWREGQSGDVERLILSRETGLRDMEIEAVLDYLRTETTYTESKSQQARAEGVLGGHEEIAAITQITGAFSEATGDELRRMLTFVEDIRLARSTTRGFGATEGEIRSLYREVDYNYFREIYDTSFRDVESPNVLVPAGGSDISSVLLLTNATKALFVDAAPFGDQAERLSGPQTVEYLNEKKSKTWYLTRYSREGPSKMRPYIELELNRLGVKDYEIVREASDSAVPTYHLRFEWAYPGENPKAREFIWLSETRLEDTQRWSEQISGEWDGAIVKGQHYLLHGLEGYKPLLINLLSRVRAGGVIASDIPLGRMPSATNDRLQTLEASGARFGYGRWASRSWLPDVKSGVYLYRVSTGFGAARSSGGQRDAEAKVDADVTESDQKALKRLFANDGINPNDLDAFLASGGEVHTIVLKQQNRILGGMVLRIDRSEYDFPDTGVREVGLVDYYLALDFDVRRRMKGGREADLTGMLMSTVRQILQKSVEDLNGVVALDIDHAEMFLWEMIGAKEVRVRTGEDGERLGDMHLDFRESPEKVGFGSAVQVGSFEWRFNGEITQSDVDELYRIIKDRLRTYYIDFSIHQSPYAKTAVLKHGDRVIGGYILEVKPPKQLSRERSERVAGVSGFIAADRGLRDIVPFGMSNQILDQAIDMFRKDPRDFSRIILEQVTRDGMILWRSRGARVTSVEQDERNQDLYEMVLNLDQAGFGSETSAPEWKFDWRISLEEVEELRRLFIGSLGLTNLGLDFHYGEGVRTAIVKIGGKVIGGFTLEIDDVFKDGEVVGYASGYLAVDKEVSRAMPFLRLGVKFVEKEIEMMRSDPRSFNRIILENITRDGMILWRSVGAEVKKEGNRSDGAPVYTMELRLKEAEASGFGIVAAPAASNVVRLLKLDEMNVRRIIAQIQTDGFESVRARLERELIDALDTDSAFRGDLNLLAGEIAENGETWSAEYLASYLVKNLNLTGYTEDANLLGQFTLLLNRVRFVLERYRHGQLTDALHHYELSEEEKAAASAQVNRLRDENVFLFDQALAQITDEMDKIMGESEESSGPYNIGYERETIPSNVDELARLGQIHYFHPPAERGVLDEVQKLLRAASSERLAFLSGVLGKIREHVYFGQITPTELRRNLPDAGSVLVVPSTVKLSGGSTQAFHTQNIIVYSGREFDESQPGLQMLAKKVDQAARVLSQTSPDARETLLEQLADYGFSVKSIKGGQFIFVDRNAFLAKLEETFMALKQTAVAA